MRLIDADALITEAFDLMDRDELLEDVPQIIKDYCDAQPTIDAVPVIRCRDCRWYYEDNSAGGWCYVKTKQDVPFDGYCHNAKRWKEDEAKGYTGNVDAADRTPAGK